MERRLPNRRIAARAERTRSRHPEATARFAQQLASVSQELRRIPLRRPRRLGAYRAGDVRGAGGLVGEHRGHARSAGPRLAHAGPIGADVPRQEPDAGTGAPSAGRHRPAGLGGGEARPRTDRSGRDDARADDPHRSDRQRRHCGPAEPAGRPSCARSRRRTWPGSTPGSKPARRPDGQPSDGTHSAGLTGAGGTATLVRDGRTDPAR